MDLRQFRLTDKSYDLNVLDSTNQLQVLESQPRNENPTPASSMGRRARNRNKNNASSLAAVPLWRSQQKDSNPTAPTEEALDLTVKKKQRVAPANISIEHNYSKRCRHMSDEYDDGYAIFKEGSAALQNLLSYAHAKSTAPPDYRSPEQNEAVCLTRYGERTDATGETLNNVDVTQPSSSNDNKINIDGVIYEIFQSTSTQTRQIDVYKMEQKITSDESEPNDDLYIEIGPLGTLIPFNAFKKIPWFEALQATHELLSLVFPLNILETHVISQRFAPLEFSDHYKGKPRLDDKKLDDIRYCITKRTKMSKKAFIHNIARRLTQLAKRRGELNKGYVVK